MRQQDTTSAEALGRQQDTGAQRSRRRHPPEAPVLHEGAPLPAPHFDLSTPGDDAPSFDADPRWTF